MGKQGDEETRDGPFEGKQGTVLLYLSPCFTLLIF